MFSLGARQRAHDHFQDLLHMHRVDARLRVCDVIKVIAVEGNMLTYFEQIVRVHVGPMALIGVHLEV